MVYDQLRNEWIYTVDGRQVATTTRPASMDVADTPKADATSRAKCGEKFSKSHFHWCFGHFLQ